jgi:hypothetical protein
MRSKIKKEITKRAKKMGRGSNDIAMSFPPRPVFSPRAAEMEERLSVPCAEKQLREKSWVYHFSAASCSARAGDFYTAISLGEHLQAEPDLPPRLRQRVEAFSESIRKRRTQWAAGLVASVSAD